MPEVITAIDIGHANLKVVAVSRRKNRYEAVAAGMTSIADLDRSDPSSWKELGQRLRKTIRKNRIPTRKVVLGLGSVGTMLRYIQIPIVPAWKMPMLMSFEVEQHAGAQVDQITHDYRLMNVDTGDDSQMTVLLALAQIGEIKEMRQIVRPAIGREESTDLTCLGTFGVYRVGPQVRDENRVVVLDIGASETSLTLAVDDRMVFTRTVAGGGRRMTQQIRQELHIPEEEAEALKCEVGIELDRQQYDEMHPRHQKVSDILAAEVGVLARDVQTSIRGARNQCKLKEPFAPDRVLVTGGTALMKGLPEALEARLGWECACLDVESSFERVRPPAERAFLGEHFHFFSAAAGLAVASVDPNGMNLDLTLPEDREKQRFWQHEMYVYYAAVAAFFIIVFTFVSGYRTAAREEQRYKQAENDIKAAEKTIAKAKAFQKRNLKLARRVAALEEREMSGQNILVAMAVLKDSTPDNILITEVATSLEATVISIRDGGSSGGGGSGGPGGPGGPGGSGDEDDGADLRTYSGEAKYRDPRVIYISGIVNEVESEGQLLDALKVFRRDLEENPKPRFFGKVSIATYDFEPRQVFEAKVDEETGKIIEPARPPIPARGVFTLQCPIDREFG